MAQIRVKKDNEEKILCPHCGEEITEVIEKNVSGGIIYLVSNSPEGRENRARKK